MGPAPRAVPATYGIELWDHEQGDEGGWSAALARQVLDGPATGLRLKAIGRAIRAARSWGWSEVSMYVYREDDDA